MKRGRVFICVFFVFLIFLSLSSFVFATPSPPVVSSAKVSFVLAGCEYNNNWYPYGSCFDGRTKFCKSSGTSWEILDNFKYGSCVQSGCCPSGYRCGCKNSQSSCPSQQKICVPSEICEEIKNEDTCLISNCYWLPGENKCLDRSAVLSCSNYTTNESCVEDVLNLGEIGLGTDVCTNARIVSGGLVTVPGSCKCIWNGTSSNGNCILDHKTINGTYSPDTLHYFDCGKSFLVSECIGGFINYSWNVSVLNKNPPTWNPDIVQMEESGCVAGSKIINCGGNAAKLPGFSFINVLLVFLGLGIFYVFLNKRRIE